MSHTLISLPTYTTAAMAHDLLGIQADSLPDHADVCRPEQQLRLQHKNRQPASSGSTGSSESVQISGFEYFTDESLTRVSESIEQSNICKEKTRQRGTFSLSALCRRVFLFSMRLLLREKYSAHPLQLKLENPDAVQHLIQISLHKDSSRLPYNIVFL